MPGLHLQALFGLETKAGHVHCAQVSSLLMAPLQTIQAGGFGWQPVLACIGQGSLVTKKWIGPA